MSCDGRVELICITTNYYLYTCIQNIPIHTTIDRGTEAEVAIRGGGPAWDGWPRNGVNFTITILLLLPTTFNCVRQTPFPKTSRVRGRGGLF